MGAVQPVLALHSVALHDGPMQTPLQVLAATEATWKLRMVQACKSSSTSVARRTSSPLASCPAPAPGAEWENAIHGETGNILRHSSACVNSILCSLQIAGQHSSGDCTFSWTSTLLGGLQALMP